MMDWFPTFMTLAGGEMPTDRPHDGRDISPVLFGTGSRADSEFYANYIDPWSDDVIVPVYEIMEHRSGMWKYGHVGNTGTNDGELYNLEADISETTNLKDAHPKIYNRLKNEYDFFTQSIVNAPAPDDIDGDEIPDKWEVANGLDPTYTIDAYLDPDGNGKTAYGRICRQHDTNMGYREHTISAYFTPVLRTATRAFSKKRYQPVQPKNVLIKAVSIKGVTNASWGRYESSSQ